MTRTEKIGVLRRRKTFLMHRISEADEDLSYDRQELSALEWAIFELEKIVQAAKRDTP